jgi:hypothetical protein
MTTTDGSADAAIVECVIGIDPVRCGKRRVSRSWVATSIGHWCRATTGLVGGCGLLSSLGSFLSIPDRGRPTVHIAVRAGRRDPYWDLDGRAVRRDRRRRQLVTSTVIVLAIAILGLVLARLAAIETTTLLTGPRSVIVVSSLAGDAIACCLVFAADLRRRAFLRQLGAFPEAQTVATG